MSKDFIGFRVTPDVKEKLEAEAEKEMRPLSHLIRDRVVRPLEVKEERTKALAKARGTVENDPSNLNVTLNEKGSVVKEYEEIPQSDSFKKADWIAQKVAKHKLRVPTRAAETLAKKEWDKR